MKNLQEVKEHLLHCGYSNSAIQKICGFLVGSNLKSVKEVIKYRKGERTFEDFLVWFTIESDGLTTEDLEYGDYVHVCNGHDVIVITIIKDSDLFVGTDGVSVGCYMLDKNSRLCTDEELAKVLDRLHENCLDFDYSSEMLVPFNNDEE